MVSVGGMVCALVAMVAVILSCEVYAITLMPRSCSMLCNHMYIITQARTVSTADQGLITCVSGGEPWATVGDASDVGGERWIISTINGGLNGYKRLYSGLEERH